MKRVKDIDEFHILTVKECGICKKHNLAAKIQILEYDKKLFKCYKIFCCRQCIIRNTDLEDRQFILKIWNFMNKSIIIEQGKYYLGELLKRRPKSKILNIIRLLLYTEGYNIDTYLIKFIIYYYKNGKLGLTYYKLLKRIISDFKRSRIKKRNKIDAPQQQISGKLYISKTSRNYMGAGSCSFF